MLGGYSKGDLNELLRLYNDMQNGNDEYKSE